MDDLCFFFKVEQTSLFEGLHPFFERMLSSSFERSRGDSQDLLPLPREKEVSSSRLRGKRSSLLSRYLGGACLFFIEMELFSVSLDWRKLSVSSCRG